MNRIAVWLATALRIAGVTTIVVAGAAGSARAALADVTNVDGPLAPIVRVTIERGNVIVRTWDRPSVRVDGDPSLAVERRTIEQRGGDRSVLIPQASVPTARGEQTLPAEGFVVSTIPAGPREVVLVHTTNANDAGDVTMTIPAASVFLFVRARNGDIDIQNYRGGSLVAFAGHGTLRIEDGGGTVFAQTLRGPIVMANMNAERIRSRTILGNMTFEQCTVRQIEATSVSGSIVYDDGTFQPGLARFESTNGNVAIGAVGAAQLGAHSTDAKVFTDFGAGARVDARASEANVGIGVGGPLVTASSERGNVFLYDGSLRAQHPLSGVWAAPVTTLARPGRQEPPRSGTFVPRPTPLGRPNRFGRPHPFERSPDRSRRPRLRRRPY